jgi:3-isopropylmalate/(R)-2-methylmalate dehydratase small subunit
MEPFTRTEGIAAPLLRDNIDTDAVIPVPWMKSVQPDFARALFANWRWRNGDGVTEVAGFVLNREPFRAAKILVAGANFGCGSSREHAVWALLGFGIRCVLAPSFGDIFYENAFKNGLLPVALPREAMAQIADAVERQEGGCRMAVDLEARRIEFGGAQSLEFTIDEGRRTALLAGLDEIGMTLRDAEAIAAFQQRDREDRPWIYEPALNE